MGARAGHAAVTPGRMRHEDLQSHFLTVIGGGNRIFRVKRDSRKATSMATTTTGRPVLLIGSVPLCFVTEVFEAVGAALGGLVRRIPMEETTGDRLNWVHCQVETFEKTSGTELDSEVVLLGIVRFPIYRIRAGATPADIKIAAPGYAAAALNSYQEFEQVRANGRIPEGRDFK